MPPPKPKSTRAIQDVEMHSVQSLEPLRRQPERAMAKLADWCYSCMDGGDLIACDLCERLISSHFVYGSGEVYISGVYKGRFTDDLNTNTKVYPKQPAKILGPFFLKYGAKQENAKSLVLLHFTLETISTAGSPASISKM
ncbi:hypothetical protein BJV77DRAFT_966611 [Russula vinacea]|nr:hypothetical protein BJV77DRAFT_966611 [Russula vinacea]